VLPQTAAEQARFEEAQMRRTQRLQQAERLRHLRGGQDG
jgi:hypothetical protein